MSPRSDMTDVVRPFVMKNSDSDIPISHQTKIYTTTIVDELHNSNNKNEITDGITWQKGFKLMLGQTGRKELLRLIRSANHTDKRSFTIVLERTNKSSISDLPFYTLERLWEFVWELDQLLPGIWKRALAIHKSCEKVDTLDEKKNAFNCNRKSPRKNIKRKVSPNIRNNGTSKSISINPDVNLEKSTEIIQDSSIDYNLIEKSKRIRRQSDDNIYNPIPQENEEKYPDRDNHLTQELTFGCKNEEASIKDKIHITEPKCSKLHPSLVDVDTKMITSISNLVRLPQEGNLNISTEGSAKHSTLDASNCISNHFGHPDVHSNQYQPDKENFASYARAQNNSLKHKENYYDNNQRLCLTKTIPIDLTYLFREAPHEIPRNKDFRRFISNITNIYSRSTHNNSNGNDDISSIKHICSASQLVELLLTNKDVTIIDLSSCLDPSLYNKTLIFQSF